MKNKPHPFTKEQFIEKSRKRYGDKYDYSQVEDISTRYDEVTVVCPEHGSFEVVAIDHYTGKRECPVCRPVRQYRKLKENKVTKRTRENFIEEAKALFGDRYDYSRVPDENIKGTTKVPIICPDHGEFYQAIHLHLQGSGCPVCGRDKVAEQNKVSQTEFIARAYIAHGDYYDLSEAVYTGSDDKVKVICPVHGEFWINARNFTDGQGCRQCYLDERERQARNSRRARRLYFERKQELKEVFAGVDSEKKWCNRCESFRDREDFRVEERGKQHPICKECEREKRREYWENLSPEEKQRKYDRSSKRIRERTETEPEYRLVKLVRGRIQAALRERSLKKEESTMEHLGCTPSQLQEYLEGLGYEKGRDAVDHVVPLARFDLSDPTAREVAFNYRNLQPLTIKENMQKHKKLPSDWEERVRAIADALGRDPDEAVKLVDTT